MERFIVSSMGFDRLGNPTILHRIAESRVDAVKIMEEHLGGHRLSEFCRGRIREFLEAEDSWLLNWGQGGALGLISDGSVWLGSIRPVTEG